MRGRIFGNATVRLRLRCTKMSCCGATFLLTLGVRAPIFHNAARPYLAPPGRGRAPTLFRALWRNFMVEKVEKVTEATATEATKATAAGEKFVKDAVAKATALGDQAFREGFDKSLNTLNDLNAHGKRNLEAVVASVTAATKGAEQVSAQAVA